MGLPWRVVVAAEGEKPLGMCCWEQSIERDSGNDAPALGNERSFTRKHRLCDREFFERFRFLQTVKSKL